MGSIEDPHVPCVDLGLGALRQGEEPLVEVFLPFPVPQNVPVPLQTRGAQGEKCSASSGLLRPVELHSAAPGKSSHLSGPWLGRR